MDNKVLVIIVIAAVATATLLVVSGRSPFWDYLQSMWNRR